MKKVMMLSLLCSLVSAAVAMNPKDQAAATSFQANAEFKKLVAQAKAGLDAKPTKEVRQWFASMAQLISSNADWRALSAKANGLQNLFGAEFANTVGSAPLQTKANTSVGALLTAYDIFKADIMRNVPAGGGKPAPAAKTLAEAAQKAIEAMEAVQKKLVDADPADLDKLKKSGLKVAAQALAKDLP